VGCGFRPAVDRVSQFLHKSGTNAAIKHVKQRKVHTIMSFYSVFFNNVPLSYFLFMQRWNGTDIKSLVVQICDFTGDAFQGEEWV
jgi:hypothetical protein